MEVPDYLLEEMFRDLTGIRRQVEMFSDRWATYGEALQKRLTAEQRKRMEAEFSGFIEAMKVLGN